MIKNLVASIVIVAAFSTPEAFLAQAPSQPTAPAGPPQPGLTLTSAAFDDGGIIPNKYTKAATPATPVSPELAWTNVPAGTVSFVLVMHDPDTALKRRTDEVLHWLMVNIPGVTRELQESVPTQAQLPDGSMQLPNQFKEPAYGAPGAPAAGPYHHYTIELYALDSKLNLAADATEAAVDSAMQGHILGKAVLMGRFHRP